MDVTITNMRKRSMQSCDGRHSAAIAKAPDPKTKLAEVRARRHREARKACGGQGRKSGGTSRQIVRKNPIESSAIWGSVVAGEAGGTSGWTHGLGYLCSAFRREGLIPDELSLQLSTFLRSLDLFLELRVRTVPPRSLTTNQPRRGGKQCTDGPELSRFHFGVPSIHETIGRARLRDYRPLVDKLATTVSRDTGHVRPAGRPQMSQLRTKSNPRADPTGRGQLAESAAPRVSAERPDLEREERPLLLLARPPA